MSFQSLSTSADRLVVRYLPLLAWLFLLLTGYGVGTILAAVIAGRRAVDGGLLMSLVLLGGLMLFVLINGGDVVSATFDRSADRLRISRFGLRGLRVIERPLHEVVGLHVEVLRRSQHRVVLQLRSGERLPLTHAFVVTFSASGFAKIADFLGIEPALSTAPTNRWIR